MSMPTYDEMVEELTSFFPVPKNDDDIVMTVRQSEFPPGWMGLIWKCHTELKEAFPEGYTIQQIKEKFGGLRYYVSVKGESALRMDLFGVGSFAVPPRDSDEPVDDDELEDIRREVAEIQERVKAREYSQVDIAKRNALQGVIDKVENKPWKIANSITSRYESMSFYVCETCGTSLDVTTEGKYWIRTLCGSCRELAEFRAAQENEFYRIQREEQEAREAACSREHTLEDFVKEPRKLGSDDDRCYGTCAECGKHLTLPCDPAEYAENAARVNG